MALPTVQASENLEKIRLLPRRDWEQYPITELVGLLSEALATPVGVQTLRPVQAVSLMELHDFGGLFAPIQVGGGKTLLSALAPQVVGAKRPALIVPASLRGKTKREFRAYARHWRIPPTNIQSYQTLSRTQGQTWLDVKAPDLIILDECHYVKTTRAAVTRKISRYLRENPHCRVMAMSGTAASRSLRDFWHIIRWCLRSNAPVPARWEEMTEWALALDAKVDDLSRLQPGPLLTLGQHDPQAHPVEQGRQAFGDRLYHTPGVVVVKDSRPAAGLEIRAQIVDLPSSLDQHFETLRTEWETPDGHPFEDAFTLWRHARELACGFYYRWDPRPPDEWMDKRKAWHGFARNVLSASRTLDSGLQVVQAVDQGKINDFGMLQAWRDIKPTFIPNSVPVWVDDTSLNLAAEWLEREKGICWVEHRAFGKALADLTGIPHYQAGGVDPVSGKAIDQVRGPAIAQAKPCSTGFNLQTLHYKNMIVSCEPTGKQLEQLLGRTHRPGQDADTVFVDILLACLEQYAGFEQARKDAAFAQKTPPSLQKLCYATYDLPSLEECRSSGGRAWT